MSLSNNPAVYADCYAEFEKALDAARGTRLTFSSAREARAYAARLNKARVLDRARRMKVLNPADPDYGHSDYDHIRVRIVGESIELVKFEAPIYEVSEL